MTKQAKNPGRKLSYLLRHAPADSGVVPGVFGELPVEVVLAYLDCDRQALNEIVSSDSKGRFVIEGSTIRAVQGHSFPVTLKGQVILPPEKLFHGTTMTAWKKFISVSGLMSMSRTHVHLSGSEAEAAEVAFRRKAEKHVKIVVQAAQHQVETGAIYTQAENGVWLVDSVPAKYLSIEVWGSV